MNIKPAYRAIRQLSSGARALALVWRVTPGWTLAWGFLLIAQGIIPAIQALLVRAVINRLVRAPGWHAVAIPISGVAALWILSQVFSSALAWVRAVQAETVQDEIHRLIHAQALRVDMDFYDHAESYDLLHRVRADAMSQPVALLESLGSLVQSALGLGVLGAILWTYARWLPFVLVLSGCPGLLLMAGHILKEHRWRVENTTRERRVRYFDWLLTERSVAAELRLFDLGTHHRHAFESVRRFLLEGRMKLERQGALAELAAGTLAWMGSLLGLGWILQRTLSGKAGLGDLVFCFQAFQSSQTLLRGLLEGSSRIYRSLLFVENLDDFLRIQPAITGGNSVPAPLALRRSIRFESVSFIYPGSSHKALDGFSLEIPQGTVVALVGHNGAGKSTLIKLLCRFYDPEEGRILWDGVDLQTLDPAGLRHGLSVLFQDPVHYHATVRENIAFGNIRACTGNGRVEQAAIAAGATDAIASLPGGMDAQLGKWFGGAELSGGEWQRIALARAFFRDAPMVILDEPTSAMDSWAEQDWLNRFRTLTRGRTGLIITHRFTTAMHADVIHVLNHGRIVESGSHAELIGRGGEYARSWKAQIKELHHA